MASYSDEQLGKMVRHHLLTTVEKKEGNSVVVSLFDHRRTVRISEPCGIVLETVTSSFTLQSEKMLEKE